MTEFQITLVDIAARAREQFGEDADYIAGRKLPDHEWHFELLYGDGGKVFFGADATAAEVQAYIDRIKREGL